jgi:demethylmenaquinone methyltransferase/2-methoxy-6-polyprenyl-1,4-benzoquinol methylase
MAFTKVHKVINSKKGVVQKYNSSSDCYHLIMGVFEIKPNLDALELVDIKPGEKVLDVAFGTGWVLEKIIQRVGLNKKVYGIDFATEMHRVAKQRLRKSKIEDRAVFTLANALDMPYENNSFDVVFASFILDLLKIEDMPKLLNEVKRVLKPNGRAVFVALTKEGEGLKKIARCLYDWFYPIWPTICGYRASSRPIYVNKEIEKADLKVIREKLSHIVFFNFPVKIVVCKK